MYKNFLSSSPTPSALVLIGTDSKIVLHYIVRNRIVAVGECVNIIVSDMIGGVEGAGDGSMCVRRAGTT